LWAFLETSFAALMTLAIFLTFNDRVIEADGAEKEHRRNHLKVSANADVG
jgi:hypothetical protein